MRIPRSSITSVRRSSFLGGTASAAFKGAIRRQADRARNGGRQLFSAAGGKLRPAASPSAYPGFASRSKRAAAHRPPRCSGRRRSRSAVQARPARR
jgi:hypothetical protein